MKRRQTWHKGRGKEKEEDGSKRTICVVVARARVCTKKRAFCAAIVFFSLFKSWYWLVCARVLFVIVCFVFRFSRFFFRQREKKSSTDNEKVEIFLNESITYIKVCMANVLCSMMWRGVCAETNGTYKFFLAPFQCLLDAIFAFISWQLAIGTDYFCAMQLRAVYGFVMPPMNWKKKWIVRKKTILEQTLCTRFDFNEFPFSTRRWTLVFCCVCKKKWIKTQRAMEIYTVWAAMKRKKMMKT